MDAPTCHLCHKIKNFQTDGHVYERGHLLGSSFVMLYQKIPNNTLKVSNNTDGENRIYCYLLFSAPNK